MRSYEFYIKPAAGECDEAAIVLGPSDSAVLSGHVADENDVPVEGALALLFEQESGTLLASTVSDSLGRFWFGPLAVGPLYFVRVQKLDNSVRTVELHS